MAVLVTGGAGYIGSHTCKILSQAGLTPVVYDNLSTGHADSVKWGPLVKGDVRDRDRLRSAIRQWQPTCVIHFAASAYVGESVTEPAKYYNNNVAGMIALMDCCIDARLRRVVFSSSCATVGAVLDTSNTRPSLTTMGVGPSPRSIRPTNTASRQSSGNGKAVFVMISYSSSFRVLRI